MTISDDGRADVERALRPHSAPVPSVIEAAAPFLLVEDRGAMAAACAELAASECAAAGARVVRRYLEPGRGLAAFAPFPSVMIFLPDQQVNVESLDLLETALRSYRQARPQLPNSIDEAVAGRREWFEFGVVQVFGKPTVLLHRDTKRLLRYVDVPHLLMLDEAPDLFGVFAGRRPPSFVQPARHGLAEQVNASRDLCRRWNVMSTAEAEAVVQVVERLSAYYDTNVLTYSEKGSLLGGRNVVDCIVLGIKPPQAPVELRNAKQEHMATAVRKIVKDIRARVPAFARPSDRPPRGAVEDFARLYAAAIEVTTHGM